MIKLKTKCSRGISGNFYDYYLLKWRIKKKIRLRLNTLPDSLVVELDHGFLANNKSLLKILFSIVETSRLEYYRDSNKITIYDRAKGNKKQFEWDVFTLETVEKAVNFCKTIKEYDKDFFLIGIDGADFLIRKRVSSDIHVIQENFLEEQYSFIYPFIKDSIVIDIGANIGDTVVLFCKRGARRVYAYEPHPFFFNLANRNIELNRLGDKIRMVSYGIGAREAMLTLKEDSASGPTGSFGGGRFGENREVKIKIMPFSKVIESVDGPIVVKMDCEGSEFDAILSCPVSALRKIKAMAIEFHKAPDPIIEYLKRAGFDVEIKYDNPTKYGRIGLLSAVLKEEIF
ncbi:MAG: FkbM family methyltransferase [Candidatus Omnitrophica bacterium]|nr:FkbM family methyltransferase [Candidatus Omnitrophota bacterium]